MCALSGDPHVMWLVAGSHEPGGCAPPSLRPPGVHFPAVDAGAALRSAPGEVEAGPLGQLGQLCRWAAPLRRWREDLVRSNSTGELIEEIPAFNPAMGGPA
jgi:hypothetical protein